MTDKREIIETLTVALQTAIRNGYADSAYVIARTLARFGLFLLALDAVAD